MTERLRAGVDERERVLSRFLEAESGTIALACHAMARSFARGGILIPFGVGGAATDAAHAAVEFMHPVIVGKRALPAVAPANDPTRASSLARLGRPGDIALSLAHGPEAAAVREFRDEARRRGLLTVAMTGAGERVAADFCFAVPSEDPAVVQEAQETVYHVLWELVHVFFEHPGLIEDTCLTCSDAAVEGRIVEVRAGTAVIELGGVQDEVAIDLLEEDVGEGDVLLCHAGVALEKVADEIDPAGFLYPFLGAEEESLDALLADVEASTLAKGQDTIRLRRTIDLDAVAACGRAIRERLERGGRLIAFGNGGSSTDAQDVAADCLAFGWPAVALTNDAATITAVGNDVGYDKVFARQIIPLGRAEDIALAISTSGSSANILAGLEEAHRRRMLTCAVTGYDGGRLGEVPWLDYLFVAPSDSIPRIQEGHATLYHLLLEAIGAR